jgi:hypothetical protein
VELERQAEVAKVRCNSANFSNSEERISPVTFAVIENGSLTSIKFVPMALEEKGKCTHHSKMAVSALNEIQACLNSICIYRCLLIEVKNPVFGSETLT